MPISMRQAAAILTLWGVYDPDPSRAGMDRLNAWLRENYGVDHWRFLTPAAANQAAARLDVLASRALRQRQRAQRASLRDAHGDEAANMRRARLAIVQSNPERARRNAK